VTCVEAPESRDQVDVDDVPARVLVAVSTDEGRVVLIGSTSRAWHYEGGAPT
jgi:hypothetical protein